MKKRAVSVMLTAAMVSAMLAGCGSKNAETQSAADTTAESAVSGDETSADTQAADAETTDASKTDGTFTVGFDQDFPPMGFVGDDGEFTGFDLEMAAEVAKRLNLTIAYQPIAWDAKDMELDAGTIDCIWNGFTMNGREDDYEWSKPYMKNNQVFVVRGDSDINSEADLAGKNVEVQTDSSAEAALNDNSELTSMFGSLTPVADYNTAFMDLESGAVDAIAMDDVVASYQITSRKADFKVLDDVIAAEEYGIGFKKGNTGLRDKVQATLEEMAADGTAAKDFREVVRKRHHNDPVNQTENKRRAVASAAALLCGQRTKVYFSWFYAKKGEVIMGISQMLMKLAEGMATSCWIFGITLLFSLPLGMVIAFGRMSKKRIVQGITKIYISIMRGTPLMLQLMVVYFGPYYLFGIKISPFYRNIAVVIGFVLNYAAYFAEIYRSGIESMPVGQYEAAEILGYSKSQTFLHIILPQVIKRILPSVTNEVITLVKDTSLAFVIAVSEMFTIAKALASSQTSMVPYVAAGIFYYVFNFLVAWIMEKIEKHLSYYR